MALEQCREHARRVDAADLGDFERGDRLLVGDDGERLERLDGELLCRALVEQPPHPLVQVGTRDDLVAAGDLDELESAGPIVVALQRGDCGLHVFFRFGVEQLVQLPGRERLG